MHSNNFLFFNFLFIKIIFLYYMSNYLYGVILYKMYQNNKKLINTNYNKKYNNQFNPITKIKNIKIV